MVDILDVLILTPGPRGRKGLPAILWGSPGGGKTSLIESAGRRHGLPCETVILGIREPADVGGLPVVSPEGVNLEPPSWAKRLRAAGRGLCFLDEISVASPSVQGAALRVVAEGVVGDLPMPPEVRILAASNPEDQSAGGWSLTAPMANRMIHLDWETPSADAWGAWLTGDGKLGDGHAPTLDNDHWDRTWAAARSSWAAFVKARPQTLLQVPKTDAERGRAWPSPRSHEIACRAYAGCLALGLRVDAPVTMSLIAGAVGQGVATEALEYLRRLDLPDPEEILRGRAKVPTDRSDRTYASLAGVVALAILGHPDQHERFLRALEVAGDVAEKRADVAAACCAPLATDSVRPIHAAISTHPATEARYVKVLTTGALAKIGHLLRGEKR